MVNQSKLDGVKASIGMRKILIVMWLFWVWTVLLPWGETFAQEYYNVAVFTFEASEKDDPEFGRKITDLVTAHLSGESRFRLVERNKIADIFKELGLSLTGIVDQAEVVKIGKLVGAQIIVTGRVFTFDEESFIIARIIGVETSRIYAEKVKGSLTDKISPMVDSLSKKIIQTISANAPTMIARETPLKEKMTELKVKLRNKNLPMISVVVLETYSGSLVPDSASETELIYILRECGFEVYEDQAKSLADWAKVYLKDNIINFPISTKADVIILGEAIGEFASRRGELVSSKAHVEFRAIESKEGKILAIARKTYTAVDLSASMASKKALQEATAAITPDFITQLVEDWNK